MKSIADSTNKRKYPFSTFTHEVTQMNKPSLGAAALWYAQHGYYVLPLVPGGKLPITEHGVNDATRDQVQIKIWWQQWPQANIGIAAGKSGLIVLDFDPYRGAPTPASIGADEPDEPTVMTKTAHGGLHLWYRTSAGMRLGNGTGDLPAGIDVRGHGGYVVAPPSVLADGKSYRFADGHKPTDCKIAQLPAYLLERLQHGRQGPQSTKITFAGHCTGKPDLSQWRLSQRVIGLIVGGAAKGERSEVSMSVCHALLAAGATPDDVRAVFVHYAIGEKYREKGNGDRWLALGLGKINLAPVDPIVDPLVAHLPALRVWVGSADCVTALKAAGFHWPADYQKKLCAIVDRAMARRVTKVSMSNRQLAELANSNPATCSRHLTKLTTRGWLPLAGAGGDYAKVFDLKGLFTLAKIDVLQSETPSSQYGARESAGSGSPSDRREGGCLTLQQQQQQQQFVGAHLADDAFVSYPVRYAAKLRPGVDILPDGLNSRDLFIAAQLDAQGELPQPELALRTGFSYWTVGASVRRMASMDLLFIQKVGRHNLYSLHPNFEERLDDLRPKLPSYGQGQLRAAKAAGARADYLTRQLQGRSMLDPGERIRMQARRDAYDATQTAHRNAAQAMGLNVGARLCPPRPSRPHLKIDHEELWRSQQKPLLDDYARLGPAMAHKERLRHLALANAGPDALPAVYQALRRQLEIDLRIAQRTAIKRNQLTITPSIPTIEVEEDPLMHSLYMEIGCTHTPINLFSLGRGYYGENHYLLD